MSKKATFKIQIKRFFHICFHEGVIPILFQGKINHRFSFAPFYIPVKRWICGKEFFIMMEFIFADLCLMYPHDIFSLKEYASSIIMVNI